MFYLNNLFELFKKRSYLFNLLEEALKVNYLN